MAKTELNKKYQVEAQKKWGKTDASKEHNEKTKDYSQQKWDHLIEEMDGIMAEFAACLKKGETPDSSAAQMLVQTLRSHITKHYYHCTKEILASLGKMYVADVRFQNNIDRHAAGTAAFVSAAIETYCATEIL